MWVLTGRQCEGEGLEMTDAADAGMHIHENNRFIFISSTDAVPRCGTDATDAGVRGSVHLRAHRSRIGWVHRLEVVDSSCRIDYIGYSCPRAGLHDLGKLSVGRRKLRQRMSESDQAGLHHDWQRVVRSKGRNGCYESTETVQKC
jgi:hypothetical protein